MNAEFDVWLLIAGLGIFLFGMGQLEHGLTELGGASFRKMMRRFTKKSFHGVLTGIVMTAILQSSSLVSLMVLAFLGAKIIRLKNALGVILGAHIGTVVTAWLVATLGFSLPIKAFAFPFIGLGSLAYLFVSTRPFLKNLGLFLLGFGLLFLGLDFMKEAIEGVAESVSMEQFADYGRWVFLLVGIVVTALIQSSSAMIVIVLSSLNAGVIDLTQGAVLVIGSNIGTTITVGIGALKGVADKKRLALAHVIINVVAGLLFFILVDYVVRGVLATGAFTDPLLQLVLISTVMKVGGVLLFFPLLAPFERWLLQRFKNSEAVGATVYVKNVPPDVPEIAIQATEKELILTIERCVAFIENALSMTTTKTMALPYLRFLQTVESTDAAYQHLKNIEDELTDFSLRIQERSLSEHEVEQLDRLMQSIRSLIYAAKEIRDITHNVKDIKQSQDKSAKEILEQLLETMKHLFLDIREALKDGHIEGIAFYAYKEKYLRAYPDSIADLYRKVKDQPLRDISISSMTNVIRKVFSSMQYLSEAVDQLSMAKETVFPEVDMSRD